MLLTSFKIQFVCLDPTTSKVSNVQKQLSQFECEDREGTSELLKLLKGVRPYCESVHFMFIP